MTIKLLHFLLIKNKVFYLQKIIFPFKINLVL